MNLHMETPISSCHFNSPCQNTPDLCVWKEVHAILSRYRKRERERENQGLDTLKKKSNISLNGHQELFYGQRSKQAYRCISDIVISFHSKHQFHGSISSLNFDDPCSSRNRMPRVELFEISRPCSLKFNPKKNSAKIQGNFGRDMSHQAFDSCHSAKGSQMFEESSSSVQNAAVDSEDASTALTLPFKQNIGFFARWAYLLQTQQAYERVWSKWNICSHVTFTCRYVCHRKDGGC